MFCPHFSKIKFQKIKEISNEQTHFQQQVCQILFNSKKSNGSNNSQQSYDIPQEGIEQINNLKSKISGQKYKFNQLINKKDSMKQNQNIKLPKQMNIKKIMMGMSQIQFQSHQPIFNNQQRQFKIPQIQYHSNQQGFKVNQSDFKMHESGFKKHEAGYKVHRIRYNSDEPLICNTNQQQSLIFDTNKGQISTIPQLIQQDDISMQQIHHKYQNQSQLAQIPSQKQNFNTNNIYNPHILVSRSSMMNNETFQIYNGLIFLNQQLKQPYQCQLTQYIIKITKNSKIKYFIELLKVKVNISSNIKQNDKMIKMNLICNTKNHSLNLYFMTPLQKQIFMEVYNIKIKKIKQIRQLKKYLQENKENLREKGFYEEEQSQILNQNNDIDDNQNQSNISLELSSYDGDSLVFLTQRLSFNQVKQKGNTFDVLLFKNKSFMSKFQRIFTNSDYDHTAMLLRTATNQLLMLQATSNAGVAIYTFNSLMKIDIKKYFSRIGLRRYNGQKNLNKIQRLQNFIRRTVGKKYKFDPMYLIKSQANQSKQTFFCSQLVAQALQDVAILSNQIPSFKYLPKHFAQQSLNNNIIDGKYSDTIILQ